VGPAFTAIGRKTVWLGEAGQGSRMKLVVNAYMSTLIEGVAEAGHCWEDVSAARLTLGSR
jgi:3-hydroxyisobutyrate dehydrogenase-like beta-hydroxyacid dehydrogenase